MKYSESKLVTSLYTISIQNLQFHAFHQYRGTAGHFLLKRISQSIRALHHRPIICLNARARPYIAVGKERVMLILVNGESIVS